MGGWRSLNDLWVIPDKPLWTIFIKQRSPATFSASKVGWKKRRMAALLAGELYAGKLSQVFAEVSTPFVLRNSQNSIMYHLMMAANNKTAIKIANEVIEPKK